jgi:hypothetical protein
LGWFFIRVDKTEALLNRPQTSSNKDNMSSVLAFAAELLPLTELCMPPDVAFHDKCTHPRVSFVYEIIDFIIGLQGVLDPESHVWNPHLFDYILMFPVSGPLPLSRPVRKYINAQALKHPHNTAKAISKAVRNLKSQGHLRGLRIRLPIFIDLLATGTQKLGSSSDPGRPSPGNGGQSHPDYFDLRTVRTYHLSYRLEDSDSIDIDIDESRYRGQSRSVPFDLCYVSAYYLSYRSEDSNIIDVDVDELRCSISEIVDLSAEDLQLTDRVLTKIVDLLQTSCDTLGKSWTLDTLKVLEKILSSSECSQETLSQNRKFYGIEPLAGRIRDLISVRVPFSFVELRQENTGLNLGALGKEIVKVVY